MGWLKDQKIHFDKLEEEKQAREMVEQGVIAHWRAEAAEELRAVVDTRLNEVIGLTTKDGEKISIRWNGVSDLDLMANNKIILTMIFGIVEVETTPDMDGISYGTGRYEIKRDIHYLRSFLCTDGNRKGGIGHGFETFYEEHLAKYLLTFVDI